MVSLFTPNPARNMSTHSFGELNGHAVGIVLKELVRRAITVVRNERQAFEVTSKLGYGGKMNDVFTTADTKAQDVYLCSLQECFPDAGIIAEEDKLSITAKNGENMYFTIDPLDGTKAFIRRQSHGVGTMIACVKDNEIVSAYIGDINTQEIYGYRPGSNKVHRISEFETVQILPTTNTTPLSAQYIFLRDPDHEHSELSQKTIPLFKSSIVDGGSIGIWLARLWKQEVGAVLMKPSYETPWDSTPILGITQKLGYVYFKPTDDAMQWEQYIPDAVKDTYTRNFDLLVVHKSRVHDLSEYIRT